MNFSSPSKIEHVLFSSNPMGAEQDSLEQKLPASVVKALQLFMERSFWNKWAEVTETHLQAPAQQFNSSTQVSCASSGRNSPAETWVETARSSQPGSKRPARAQTHFAKCRRRRFSTLSSAAPSMPSTYSAHRRLHACSSRSCISSTPDMHEHASKQKNPHSITELLTWGSPFAKTKMPGYP